MSDLPKTVVVWFDVEAELRFDYAEPGQDEDGPLELQNVVSAP